MLGRLLYDGIRAAYVRPLSRAARELSRPSPAYTYRSSTPAPTPRIETVEERVERVYQAHLKRKEHEDRMGTRRLSEKVGDAALVALGMGLCLTVLAAFVLAVLGLCWIVAALVA
jgi:hypothetical protein